MNILFEDKDIIVVEKPPGIPVQTKNIAKKDLVSFVRNYLYEETGVSNPYLGIIHRLDQPVWGMTVFALNEGAAANLCRQIGEKTVDKYYYAVVEGILEEKDSVRLTDHLIKGRDNTAHIVDKETKGAKKAELIYKVEKTDRDNNISLLRIELITGRFHQIRAQLANAGHPIVNDVKYGAAKRVDLKNREGIALCAYRLKVKHPSTGQETIFELGVKSGDFLDKYR